jgi:hypothetical protein
MGSCEVPTAAVGSGGGVVEAQAASNSRAPVSSILFNIRKFPIGGSIHSSFGARTGCSPGSDLLQARLQARCVPVEADVGAAAEQDGV